MTAQHHPTKFNMTSPCPECPFRRDQSYLHPARAADIAYAVIHENTSFTCHNTLDWHDNDPDNCPTDSCDDLAPSSGITDASEHCAGALIFVRKHGNPNALLRLAVGIGLYDPEQLKPEAFYLVFDSIDDMIQAHE